MLDRFYPKRLTMIYQRIIMLELYRESDQIGVADMLQDRVTNDIYITLPFNASLSFQISAILPSYIENIKIAFY